jgi:hypothetical protein
VKEMTNLLTKYCFRTSDGSLTCLKIIRLRTDGFTSPPKEVMLLIFIALKIHYPVLDLHPRTVGPMESTLKSRTPRATEAYLIIIVVSNLYLIIFITYITTSFTFLFNV